MQDACDFEMCPTARASRLGSNEEKTVTEQSIPRTALVVETNYLVASVIEAPLVHAGYRVLIATDPDEAESHLGRQRVDLAVIDFRLQHAEPDGLVAMLARLGVPFIFCTAASAEEVLESFPGAQVMLKPFSDEQLLAAVSALTPAQASLPSSSAD
jgi:DNA-binding response OmpR family regulator